MARRVFSAGGPRHPAIGRLAIVALIGSLGVFAFADGLHSVHHLPDQDAASRCAIAAASTNMTGVTVDLLPLSPPAVPRLARLHECAPTAPMPQPFWVAEGRAPPLARS